MEITEILKKLLYEFPVAELRFFLPSWMEALENEHPLKQALYEAMRKNAARIAKVSEAEPAIRSISQLESVEDYRITSIDLGSGVVNCVLEFPTQLFYQILSDKSGFDVGNDGDLLTLLEQLAQTKKQYDKVILKGDDLYDGKVIE